MDKTNAVRLVESAGLTFVIKEYEYDENDLSGVTAAAKIGMPAEQVFKTLVTRGDKNGINVFCIPVEDELDLKKAARVSGNKSLEMVHVKELLALTGYIRGGCSPVGMKKKYPTYIHSSCRDFEKIAISAGICGCTLLLNPDDVIKECSAVVCDIIR